MKYKKYIMEFFACTVVPAVIPAVMLLPDQYFSEVAQYCMLGVLYSFDMFFIWNIYKRSKKEREQVLTYKLNSAAYTNAYQLSEMKRDAITQKTYDETYRLCDSHIPYDVFNYISAICKNFRDTISDITSVKQEHMSVTFIYHYVFPEAGSDDLKWRWIIGRESPTQESLDDFVINDETLYHHLLNDDVNSVFCNDKKKLLDSRNAHNNHYKMSARDKEHNEIGSVFAIKVCFFNNGKTFVEGVLMVSSYGKQFVSSSSEYSEDELKNIILDDLYPYYHRLLETELGMLYLRHQKEKEENH